MSDAIWSRLLSDEVAERVGFALWVAHLEGEGQSATVAEYEFGWKHFPQSHRDAWIKRGRRVISVALGWPDA